MGGAGGFADVDDAQEGYLGQLFGVVRLDEAVAQQHLRVRQPFLKIVDDLAAFGNGLGGDELQDTAAGTGKVGSKLTRIVKLLALTY